MFFPEQKYAKFCDTGQISCLDILTKMTHSNIQLTKSTLQWRHNEHDDVSNHQPYDCLLKRLFRRRSKKTSKLRVTGLCEGNYFPYSCFLLMTSLWNTWMQKIAYHDFTIDFVSPYLSHQMLATLICCWKSNYWAFSTSASQWQRGIGSDCWGVLNYLKVFYQINHNADTSN